MRARLVLVCSFWLSLIGCATILGIKDVPEPDEVVDAAKHSTDDGASSVSDASADRDLCGYGEAGSAGVLCGANGERCAGPAECCSIAGKCISDCTTSTSRWRCAGLAQCSGDNQYCCSNLKLGIDTQACPRTSVPTGYPDPTASCFVKDVFSAGTSGCPGLTLCRSDDECVKPAVCEMIHVVGKVVDGTVGACIGP